MTELKESARQMRPPSPFLLRHKTRTVSEVASITEAELASSVLESVLQQSLSTKEFNRMKSPVTALGIDIAKLKFDVCLIKENGRIKHKVFQNTRHGFEQPAAWLASHQASDLHTCLEATGTGRPKNLRCFCLKPDLP